MPQGTRKLSLQRQTGRDETATAVIDDLSSRAPAEEFQGPDQITTAVVEDISPDGVASVLLSGATQSCEASSLIQFPSPGAASEALRGRTVLVLLNRLTQPVILGVATQRLWEPRDAAGASEAQPTLPAGNPLSVQLDKQRLHLVASDEIRLTCGKSSFVMRRDGTVIVSGVKIVSRATQSNKVRGATVSIN
jgi:hypothetical protein